jgi:lysophospholipase L1-like esterase
MTDEQQPTAVPTDRTVLRWLRAGLAGVCLLAWSSAPATAQAPTLELRRGDRIVLVGNTLAERMQHFNHFEAFLMARFPDLELVVRNLGWSADTITLQPRPLNFGDAATHLQRQKADVVIAFFGLNESFDGEPGLAQFEIDLDVYLKTHRTARYNGLSAPRLALVSPLAHERLARPIHVDVDGRNRDLARYTDVMRRVATRNEVPFVDLFTPTLALFATAPSPLTINGIHVNEEGDREVAALLLRGLGFGEVPRQPDAEWTTALDTLRDTIRDKNREFFHRWRPVNAEYIVGRRVEPFGSVNFPGEMQQLDDMVAERDQRIWSRARGLRRDQ